MEDLRPPSPGARRGGDGKTPRDSRRFPHPAKFPPRAGCGAFPCRRRRRGAGGSTWAEIPLGRCPMASGSVIRRAPGQSCLRRGEQTSGAPLIARGRRWLSRDRRRPGMCRSFARGARASLKKPVSSPSPAALSKQKRKPATFQQQKLAQAALMNQTGAGE